MLLDMCSHTDLVPTPRRECCWLGLIGDCGQSEFYSSWLFRFCTPWNQNLQKAKVSVRNKTRISVVVNKKNSFSIDIWQAVETKEYFCETGLDKRRYMGRKSLDTTTGNEKRHDHNLRKRKRAGRNNPMEHDSQTGLLLDENVVGKELGKTRSASKKNLQLGSPSSWCEKTGKEHPCYAEDLTIKKEKNNKSEKRCRHGQDVDLSLTLQREDASSKIELESQTDLSVVGDTMHKKLRKKSNASNKNIVESLRTGDASSKRKYDAQTGLSFSRYTVEKGFCKEGNSDLCVPEKLVKEHPSSLEEERTRKHKRKNKPEKLRCHGLELDSSGSLNVEDTSVRSEHNSQTGLSLGGETAEVEEGLGKKRSASNQNQQSGYHSSGCEKPENEHPSSLVEEKDNHKKKKYERIPREREGLATHLVEDVPNQGQCGQIGASLSAVAEEKDLGNKNNVSNQNLQVDSHIGSCEKPAKEYPRSLEEEMIKRHKKKNRYEKRRGCGSEGDLLETLAVEYASNETVNEPQNGLFFSGDIAEKNMGKESNVSNQKKKRPSSVEEDKIDNHIKKNTPVKRCHGVEADLLGSVHIEDASNRREHGTKAGSFLAGDIVKKDLGNKTIVSNRNLQVASPYSWSEKPEKEFRSSSEQEIMDNHKRKNKSENKHQRYPEVSLESIHLEVPSIKADGQTLAGTGSLVSRDSVLEHSETENNIVKKVIKTEGSIISDKHGDGAVEAQRLDIHPGQEHGENYSKKKRKFSDLDLKEVEEEVKGERAHRSFLSNDAVEAQRLDINPRQEHGENYSKKKRMFSDLELKEVEKEVKGERAHRSSLSNDIRDCRLVVKNREDAVHVLPPFPESPYIGRKKLLVLDINGLLADFIPAFSVRCKPDTVISRNAVFKRPFCDDFLQFCFEKFEVGVWSSRTRKNLDWAVHFLLRDFRGHLLFCWDQSHCTYTGFTAIENRHKPLFLKEIKKLWEKEEAELPWEKGDYNESNTLLLDDSPYKALRNPPYTAIFPFPYCYMDKKDDALGPHGSVRGYLEGLAMTDNVQAYVRHNPFGQEAITEASHHWEYYNKILSSQLCRL